MAPYRALLDACVLVPVSLADTMLRVAEKGLYRPLWSDRILVEAQDAIAEIRPGVDAAKRFAVMRQAFSDALITGWEGREVGISLPDPDDRHVVAAAIHGGAHAIVTANLADFPSAALHPLGLEAVHPDDFLLDHLDLSPAAIAQVFIEQAADTRRPPLTRQELATILGRAGVPRFADEVIRLLSGPAGQHYLATPALARMSAGVAPMDLWDEVGKHLEQDTGRMP